MIPSRSFLGLGIHRSRIQ